MDARDDGKKLVLLCFGSCGHPIYCQVFEFSTPCVLNGIYSNQQCIVLRKITLTIRSLLKYRDPFGEGT